MRYWLTTSTGESGAIIVEHPEWPRFGPQRPTRLATKVNHARANSVEFGFRDGDDNL